MYMIEHVYIGKCNVERLPRLTEMDRNGKEKNLRPLISLSKVPWKSEWVSATLGVAGKSQNLN